MKALLLISLLISSAAFASTKTTKATETKALSLREIAEKIQGTSTLLEREETGLDLVVNNSGRLNSKDTASTISAENTKSATTETTKK